ncbi:MAG: hypothetical protein J1G02_03515 [Clostridiales bacterium]|nr:hypothetical protein [Clostridiales bacterium]
MRKIANLFLILLLAIVATFSITACVPNTNSNGNNGDTSANVTYEITVDANNLAVDTSRLSVCIYSMDGEMLSEKKLSRGKVFFEQKGDSYIATLSGLSEEISYSSVLLTENTKKATITLEKAKYNDFTQIFNFTFTVIVITDTPVADLDVQICDDKLCRPVSFENGNIADIELNTGIYDVKVYSNEGTEELYNTKYTVTSDNRFCIIKL